jgi:formylglycine-generating enzyme required for sulfatase activity
MVNALALCAREPLGVLCAAGTDDVGPYVRAEGYVHEVTLSAFEIDRTEVPVERYARCVSAGACARAQYGAFDARFDTPDFPVTQVRWEDAVAYCSWVGGHLPTEAQWELAARGPRSRTFPWGEVYHAGLANHGSWADEPSDGSDGFLGLAPVGSFPDGATPNGVLDMAGNAAEWVADVYERDEDGYGYGRGAARNPVTNSGNATLYGHVVRGGSYLEAAVWLRGAARRASLFAAREIGFRCAYDVHQGR